MERVISYDRVLTLVTQLDPAQQVRLLNALEDLVQRQRSPQPRRNILEIEGLGQEIWQGVDAQDYIDKERASWGN